MTAVTSTQNTNVGLDIAFKLIDALGIMSSIVKLADENQLLANEVDV